MNITIDTNLDGAKDMSELIQRLTILLNQLQQDLRNQPEFIVITSDEQTIPKNTNVNTILFKFDPIDTVKVGYYDGENQVLP